MVPMLTCGLVRSNFALAMGPVLLCGGLWVVLDGGAGRCPCAGNWVVLCGLLAPHLRDDLLGHVSGDLGVAVELHGVAGAALGAAAEVADVAEHLRQRDQGLDDAHPSALVHGLDQAAP